MPNSLTVVIPAYNEENNLSLAFDNVEKALNGVIDDYEIIVIDDGSKDKTVQVAQECMRQNPRIKCVSNDMNRGYGYSYWRGVMLAQKDYIGVFPADNDMTWESFRYLVENIGQTDFVTAYMVNTQDRQWARRILSKTFVILMNTAFGMKLKYFNGPLISRREVLQALPIRSTGLTILAESKVRMIKQGRSYLELPFTHAHRSSGRSTALRFKSVKAVVKAVGSLYRDLYWAK